MPKYEVTDPQSGRTIQLEGDSPPTEQELEEIFANVAPRQQPNLLERGIREGARQLGLTGRAIAGGAMQIAEPFTEPVRYLMNQALPGNPIGNLEVATDEALTSAGVPEPQGALERGIQSAGRFATSFAGGMGIGSKVEGAFNTLIGLSKQIRNAPLTADQLKEVAGAAYDTAEAAGVVINPSNYGNFVARFSRRISREGIDRQLHPAATRVMERIAEAAEGGRPITLKEMDTLRQLAKDARSSQNAGERRLGKIIVDELDDYVDNLSSANLISGDAKVASAALRTARDAWSRYRKSETIQEAVEKAGIRAGQFTGSGFENALRTQFRQIAMNTKRMRGFSKEEQEAIKKVAMGGKLDNAMRMLGKFAPTGVVSAAISGGGGYAVGGPAGAVAVPLLGAAARRGATKLTERNVIKADELIRRGVPAPPEGVPDWLLPWLSGAAFGVGTQGE